MNSIDVVSMKIVFIGVGGWISSHRLGHTSILVVSRDTSILLDAGECVYRMLREFGVDICGVSNIVVTHRHGDHILGLPTYIQMYRWSGCRDTLNIYSLNDVISSIKHFLDFVGVDIQRSDARFIDIEERSLSIGDLYIEAMRTCHSIPSIAVKVCDENKCIVYTGDTRFCEKLVEFSRGCDILIHEASGYEENAGLYGHSNLYEAIDIAVKASVKMFIPIHFYRDIPMIRADIARKLGEAGIDLVIPYPGYTIEI